MSTERDFPELAGILQQELLQVASEIDQDAVQKFLIELLVAKRIFIAGKGRTGFQMRSFAMRLMHLGLPVHVVDDVTTPGIQSGDLLVVGTASGRTPSLVSNTEIASNIGARIISITSNTNNPISKHSSVNILIPAPSHKNDAGPNPDTSIQPLGGLFELAIDFLLNIMVVQLMDKLGVGESEMANRHANLE
jgi:6-phospho-3-hexuloisomerase